MPYADARVSDGMARFRARRLDARLSAIEEGIDSGAIGGGPGGGVTSVNGASGVVVLDAAAVGACSASDPRLSDARTPTAHSHSLLPKIRLPPTFNHANLTTAKACTTNTSFAVYMGRADAAYTSVVVRLRVTTAAATITWAEVAVATGTPSPGGSPSLTRRGSADVAAVVNSLGQKSITVAVSGIAAGDDIWVIVGAQATTALAIRAGLADDLQLGGQAAASATRPSTMASPTTFTIEGATAACPWVGLQT